MSCSVQFSGLTSLGIGWSLIFLLLVPYSRYHFPIGPLLSILAAAFAVGLWDRTAQLRGVTPTTAELSERPE